ncbi:hypothetical protein DFH09DRAFT_297611 [Mycena vulgaris]|nr:hypothetical protein DFH09DRAFT_297611 [Mycena vulgaris]
MRRYSVRAGRVITQPIRWNSTVEPSPENPPAFVDPPSSPSANPYVSRPAAPLVPRRYRPDVDSSPYTPNISAIAATAAEGSLSSRLARERLQKTAGQQPPSAASPVSPELTFKPSNEMSADDRRELLAQRRAERLARDAISGVQPPLPGPFRVPQTSTSSTPSFAPHLAPKDPEAEMIRRREMLLARRAERMAREATATSPQRYSQPRLPNRAQASGSSPTSAMQSREPGDISDSRERWVPQPRGGGPRGRDENNFTRDSPRGGRDSTRGGTNMRGSTRGGRGAARGGRGGGREARGGGRDRGERGEDNDVEGDAFDEIADWLDSDEIHIASATEPEIQQGGLRLHSSLKVRTTLRSDRAALETLGGDYSRFIQNPQHFVSAARKLGPAKHSSVVLARHKDLPVLNRGHVQDIVGSVAITKRA